ncbi:hypothetical protein GLAREA_08409 [Glarea lozoyensis ATCC 20868]|uniref:Uncharacterized protein n=1 Tax=Glarea lozoyensis (strain ATCC 20868 / MF5171) TaxID=1116229 RepID=S3CDE8_GLAL2|nr:uncharacterized protein GLAREA_08409 [Glarea lozoyensis ATCC 20868]EPE24557.1 hypothetical protein GLAREA_08409 [Glarea lozoyensis ATCC 20868]
MGESLVAFEAPGALTERRRPLLSSAFVGLAGLSVPQMHSFDLEMGCVLSSSFLQPSARLKGESHVFISNIRLPFIIIVRFCEVLSSLLLGASPSKDASLPFFPQERSETHSPTNALEALQRPAFQEVELPPLITAKLFDTPQNPTGIARNIARLQYKVHLIPGVI